MAALFKNIIVIGGLIALAAAGYYLIVVEREAGIITSDPLSVGQAEFETQEFLQRLSEIEAIQLQATIFSDRRFTTFTDFTEPVEPIPFGRENPFEI